MSKNNLSFIHPLLLLTAAIIWGLAFVAQDMVSELGAFTIGAVRNIFATLFLFILIPVFDKLRDSGRSILPKRSTTPPFTKHELIYGTVCGAFLTVASVLQQNGINMGTSAGKASFITALYVVIVPIIALLFGKKSPVNVWISVAVAVIGFYLLCIKDGFTVEASDLLVLLGAVTFSVHITAIDKSSELCDGLRLAALQFGTSFVFNLILALIFENPFNMALIGENLLPLMYLGIASSGIAYTLQIIGQKGTPPAAASLILSLESVFGVLGAVLILNSTLSAKEYIGCAVVFAAVIFSQLDFKKSTGSKK